MTDQQNRTKIINVRATPNEYQDVERIMSALNVSQSDAVRAAIKFTAQHTPEPTQSTPANPT